MRPLKISPLMKLPLDVKNVDRIFRDAEVAVRAGSNISIVLTCTPVSFCSSSPAWELGELGFQSYDMDVIVRDARTIGSVIELEEERQRLVEENAKLKDELRRTKKELVFARATPAEVHHHHHYNSSYNP
jgi:hypothetical protein